MASGKTAPPPRGLLAESVVELIESLSSFPRVDGKQLLKEIRAALLRFRSQAMKGQSNVDEFRGGECGTGFRILKLLAPNADETPSDSGDKQGLVWKQRSQALDHQLGMTPGDSVGSSFYLGEQRHGRWVWREGIDEPKDFACSRPDFGLVALEQASQDVSRRMTEGCRGPAVCGGECGPGTGVFRRFISEQLLDPVRWPLEVRSHDQRDRDDLTIRLPSRGNLGITPTIEPCLGEICTPR